ncbi:MAG: MarR family transcriptional regulator [Armatimonadetes bacterium]|nr:MarR family transcriptional regulator [Armatimonadota bacterium]
MSGTTTLPRDSVEYLEILSDVFAEIVRRTAAREDHTAGEITPALVQCLQYIYLHGPSSIRKIGEGLSVTFPAASQLVNRLVQKNLVTREHSARDRRLARVDLTQEGRSVVSEARKARAEWLQTVLDNMSARERASLVDSLEEFIRAALDTSGRVDEACARCGIDHLAFCVVNRVHENRTGEQIDKF